MKAFRTGITTGTCAAAATHAAVRVLCGDEPPEIVSVETPSGERLAVAVVHASRGPDSASASVRKDAGDDPDVTHGVEVIVTVSWLADGDIEFAAGEGVGTITRPGLQAPPGEPAINPVPRWMIARAVREATDRPVRVEVSIPGGNEIAEETFNPRLGIVGGLSILGTTGIVRPYCRRALRNAIACSLDVAAACGVRFPILVPGNIGMRAAQRHFAPVEQQAIEVGNEWACAVDRLGTERFDGVLALGHPGKLAKLIRGQWNTHSKASEPVVGFVRATAAKILAGAVPASDTVEGVFQTLGPEKSTRLGNHLAREICRAIADRIARPTAAVVLTNMAGDILGTSGDLSSWK